MCNVGGDGDLFSVEIHHSGFFCGFGRNRTYLDFSTDFFDYCDADSWSLLWMDDFLKQLGYGDDDLVGKRRLYSIYPGRTVGDGLQPLRGDVDIVAMLNAKGDANNLVVLVDHVNFMGNLHTDDVLIVGPTQLPSVISPRKDGGSDEKKDLKKRKIDFCGEGTSAAAAEDEDQGTKDEDAEDSGGDSTDEDFIDSDYELDEGDDDLFDDNVDFLVEDKSGKEKGKVDIDDALALDVLDDDDLRLKSEELEKLKYKCKAFNPDVDMSAPVFKVGMAFCDVKELRKALTAYTIRNRVEVRKTRNEAGRLDACCKDGCPWYMKASTDSRTNSMIIKGYNETHTCQRVWKLKALTAPFLAQKFLEEFRDNPKMSLQSFASKVQKEFNMVPHRVKLGRARKAALQVIHGDEATQYNQLWDYGQEFRRANPGSKFFLSTQQIKEKNDAFPKEHFSTLYWSVDACKRGFLKGCRPIIGIDGCHLKTRFKGNLLTAVGIDPNDCSHRVHLPLKIKGSS